MRTITPKNAKLIPKDAKRVFKGQIFDVYQWRQEMFDGSFATFEMLKRPDTIKVLAIKDSKVVVLNEEQPGHGPFIDLPGGRHDVQTETELEAAKRELAEETGLEFKSWRLIKVEQPHSKIDWLVYLYLATDFAGKQERKLDAGEKIEVKLLDFNNFKDLIGSPKARYLPREPVESCANLEELAGLPEYVN